MTEEVYDVPRDFASQPALTQSAFALPACLYNIVPMKNVLDIELNKCIYEKQINFDEGTIRVTREVIRAADTLVFHTQSVLHKILCGSLDLTVEGKHINMIDMLIKKCHVAKDQQLFLQAMKLNFNIISQNNLDNRGISEEILSHSISNRGISEEILSHSISEGVGRSCLRNMTRDIPSPGSHNAYVSKWLLQNKTKIQVPGTRRPSTLCLATTVEELPPSRISSISSDSNRERGSKSPVVKKIQSVTSNVNNDSTSAVEDNEENISIQDISSHLPSNIVEVVDNLKDTNVDYIRTSSKLMDFKTLVKGRGKSTTENRKEINVKKCTSPENEGVRPIGSLFDVIKGRGRSKTIISKVETSEISKEDFDSSDSIYESDAHSQDTADCSLNKSSLEDLSTGPLSHTLSSSASPSHNRQVKLIPAGASLLPPADANDAKLLAALSSSESDAEVPMKRESLRKKLKLGCQCENCLKWETSDYEVQEKFIELKTIPAKVACTPPLFLKTEKEDLAYDIEMTKIKRAESKIQKDIAPCLLVHSLELCIYASSVADVTFCQSVHRSLNYLNLKNTYTIQSYAWPAIMRSMNICIVGAAKSGKSLCYLPAVCTFIIEKRSRYSELPTDDGPIAVVLCESLPKVEQIYNLFITILKHTREKVAIGVVIPPTSFSYLKHVKSCDILVTTPRVLIHFLKSRIINFKRLCHFVMEDADKLFAKYGNEIDTLTKGIQSMVSHRVCSYGVQVIALSEQWTGGLETFSKKLENPPMICISSYLQCAIYGRANIQMHFVSSAVKVRSICDIVKENSRTFKTVIVCNDDSDVTYISNLLQIEGASVICITSYMTEAVSEQEVLWNSTNSGRHSVLVCTDTIFNAQLKDLSVSWIITTAPLIPLPQEHWTLFSRRFKCLLDNYDCPFNSKFQPGSCKVHIYVSEDCSKQYPRLYRFLTDLGITLPRKFVDFSKNVERQEEQEKIRNNTAFCKRLKLLGNCNKFHCNKRHVVDPHLDLENWIPTAGIVKFNILHIQNATVFSVRLLEHMDINRNVHKIKDDVKFVTHNLTDDMRRNTVPASQFCTRQVYAYFDEETGTYHRCKLLKVLHQLKNTKSSYEVWIKLIDAGKEKRTMFANLYKLPSRYIGVPPQSLDVYLANILPPDQDEDWSIHTKNKVSNIIHNVNFNRDHRFYTGRIVLQIGDTLWLDDIKLQETLEYSNDTVTIFQLKKKLLQMELCRETTCQLEGLYEVYQHCGLDLPRYELKALSNGQKLIKQVEPQWAFLEEDYNVVYFSSAESPGKFYVRQQKYQKLFQQLQRELQLLVNQPSYPKITDIIINSCYLAQDPEGDEYARVIVRNIEEDMVDCFFVDFGDYTKVQKNELKFLPDNFITRLPFQTIECSLYGVEPILDCWAYEATDVFYDHCFEVNTNIYKNLFIKYFKLTQCEQKGKNIYSVILLDYVSEKPIFINNILIDCGFATTVKDEPLVNMTLPIMKEELEEDDWNVDNDTVVESNELDNKMFSQENEEDIWDIQINDMDELVEELFGKVIIDVDAPSAPIGSSISSNLKPITALPAVNYSTPDVVWYQTDQLIKFDIQLPDVVKYTTTVLRKSIFCFSTIKNETEYKLNFQLFGNVNSTFQHIGGGPVVRITLTKLKPGNWERLTFSDQKMRNIRYDMSKYVFPEEKKRLFLEIEKDEDEEADNNEIIVEIGSDIDYSESDIETDIESN
ncbi:DEAD/DEAH box helicase [Popillia japonica]|uniref:RNA helicase n=1 Tax=Popillia japonica TaxID=7064 RepID=A0AAW1HVN9_POPJA